MKCFTLLLLFVLSLSRLEAEELKVVVDGILEKQGLVAIGVFNKKETFPSGEQIFGIKVNTGSSEQVVHIFKDIPAGNYALAVYHDLNSNDKLDTNFFGKPNEPYGFSNNKFGAFGTPPDFEKAVITIKKQEKKEITIFVD